MVFPNERDLLRTLTRIILSGTATTKWNPLGWKATAAALSGII
jgi:hypothetical protein